MSLDICEIFHSLQGESTFSGLPCVFVRLSGCNIACSWCDTRYAETEAPESLTRAEILDRIKRYHCPTVEITGGEPLLQKETPELICDLIREGFTVLLETNGSQSIAAVDERCIRILDIKCPSSGEAGSFLEANFDLATARDEFKFVVGNRQDYEFAKGVIEGRLSGHPAARIHISPVFGSISPQRLAAWILEDRLHARLSLQQHKLIWHPDQRGV